MNALLLILLALAAMAVVGIATSHPAGSRRGYFEDYEDFDQGRR